jgi:glycosyltransferase involved in cell wall biosynthesis
LSSPVSVVIPTYNGAKLIDRALRSIFAQTYLPGEVVVVDDCSSDGTPAAVAALAKGAPVPVRLIRLARNSGGPGRPLNTGVAAAAGEVIALLEQDDLMRPLRIEKQMEAVRRFPDCSLITGRCTVYGNADGDMRPVWPVPQFDGVVDDIDSQPEFFVLDPQRAFRGLLHRQIMVGHSNFCFAKRSWRRIGGFSEKGRVCVDLDFAFKAVMSGSVVIVNHFVTDYDYRADSLFRQDLARSGVEAALLRLKFAANRRDWAAEEFPALQSTSLGFAKTAVLQKDWLTLARVAVPLLRYVDVRSVVRALTRRWLAKV